MALPEVQLKSVRLHAVTESQCVEHILDEQAAGRGGWVVTPNLDHLRRLVRDETFADLCRGADLMVADGMPLVWASRLQRTPLPERVAGSNLIWSVCEGAARTGRSVFLLGGNEGTAERAADVLVGRYPGLRIAGILCPPLGFERDAEQSSAITTTLREARPDIVFVALGSPKQEEFIRDHRESLPATWWLGIGISFSFVCGEVRRAPVWIQRLGLEWATRLLQEPRRLARRYLLEGLPFAFSLLAGSTWRGVFGRRKG